MPYVLQGLELSRRFYHDLVAPVLAAHFPDLAYAAALIGPGSEVLGYDTAISTDHDWGPRLLLFLSAADIALTPSIEAAVHAALPDTFLGYATRIPWSAEKEHSAVYGLSINTVTDYATSLLGVDVARDWRPADWLLVPEQALLELTAGAVFHDGLGELEPLRARLAYHPHDVWLYRMAMQWRRIAQVEPFVGRTGDVGDELGSRLIAASVVHDMMQLAFLIERTYAPYAKWFGTAFTRLRCAPRLTPLLSAVLQAVEWHDREAALSRVYSVVATLHNALGVTEPLGTAVTPFYTRPYHVLGADRFVNALRAAIMDPEVARAPLAGAVDQLSDSTDLLGYPPVRQKLRGLYD